MKKIMALILMLLMACSTALAETDYASMETNELYQIYEDVLAEILRRSQPVDRPEATTDESITFRGIPWGVTPAEFTDAMAAVGLKLSYGIDDMPSFERDLYWTGELLSLYTLDDAGFFTKPSTKNMTVAGFPVTSMGAYFLYGFDEENVYKDQDHARFYMAYYQFDPVNFPAAYDTLIIKLNQLYGQGEVHPETIAIDQRGVYTWGVWTGADHTAVCLIYRYARYNDGSRGNERLYLYYGRSNSVDLLKELEAAMTREELEQAAGDMSGL